MPELPSTPPPTVRQDLITTAVAFLSDPAVAASPLSRRLAFLEQKGLTPQEIELAVARVQGAMPASTTTPTSTSATMTTNSNAQMQSERPFNWRGLAVGSGAALATAFLIHQNIDMLKVSVG